MHHVLTPAYGRDYKNKKSVIEDFNGGKDFTLNSPRGTTYCSKRDFETGDSIELRYKDNRQLTVVKI